MTVRGISDPAFPAEFLSPDIDDSEPLVSLELGGIALNDPSQGREVQTWRCRVDAGVVKVGPVGGVETAVFTVVGVLTSLSLAFDSNMAPTFAYVEDGVQKLRWFNTLTAAIQTDSFAGASDGRVSTDDKRDWAAPLSDVVFAYARGGVLYYREQRDRYLIEYTVGPTEGLSLRRFGMNAAGRLQFELRSITE